MNPQNLPSLSPPQFNIRFKVYPDGQRRPIVSSLEVAKHFGRNHKNVMRDLRKLLSSLPEEFIGLNFELNNFIDTIGRELSCYLLTRDAFTLLVMGWTGHEAINWKLRYIEAFNSMEKAAFEAARQLSPGQEHFLISQGLKLARRLTPERRREIKRAVRYKALGLTISEVARLLDCGREKVRNLLLDHELSQGGGQ